MTMSSSTLTLACMPPRDPNCIRNPTTCSSYSVPVKFRRPELLKIRLLSSSCSSTSSSLTTKPDWVRGDNAEEGERVFIVVNFYRFVFIEDPEGEVTKHLAFLQDCDIHGRIYINEQGINAQYSGPSKEALAYVNWLKGDERFHDILVQMEGGISHLPLLDSSMRATPLTPAEWRSKIQAENNIDVPSSSNVVLLDVRNGYEWDIGHFRGAQRPNVDCFRSTSFGLSGSEDITSDPLANVDKEKTDILMYCTGGIRCDVYSAILRQKGYEKLYTLKGGITHYLQCEGPVEWIGNLFVFDSRLSLPPPSVKQDALTDEIRPHENTVFAKCYVCGSQVSDLRHRNCANLDCNLLFLCCLRCMDGLRGCCSSQCTCAPRRRPVLSGHERYKKWHHYRDM